MKLSLLSTALAAVSFIGSSSAISILASNDDGFAAAQLREFYRLLKEAGHEVIVVAPVDNESGHGGQSFFTNNKSLVVDSEYGIIPAGAPSLGRDPTDPDIWYYNGTPSACTFVALDYVIPNFYGNRSIDLYVGGPNFGLNAGYFFYTLSGTIGGAYAAAQRNIPAIGFSGANGEQRSYTWINKTTASGFPDPATIHAQVSVDIVNQLVKGTKPGKPLLPLGYGINVNTPFITSLTNDSCVAPKLIQTRLGGGGTTDKAVYNATTGIFSFANLYTAALNACINGDCTLPGENPVVNSGCFGSVSVFSIDYDAPIGLPQAQVRAALEPLVAYDSPLEKMKVKARDSMSSEEASIRHPHGRA